MHTTSLLKMSAFRDAYAAGYHADRPTVLDVGSLDAGGQGVTYRTLFGPDRYDYVGLDISSGLNVDLVPADPFAWSEIEDESFDFVISGQSFEHNTFFWITMAEISRVLRVGGFAAVIAPSSGVVHRFPRDCWRFYPDSWAALGQYCGLGLVEHYVESGRPPMIDGAEWEDAMAVFTKPEFSSERQRTDFYRRLALIVDTRCGTPADAPEQRLGPALLAYEELIGSGELEREVDSATAAARQWWQKARRAPEGILVVESPPDDPTAPVYTPLEVSGWVWPIREGTQVRVEVDGRTAYEAVLGVPRWDVKATLGDPGAEIGGFLCPLGADVLPPGEHALAITKSSPGSRDVTVTRLLHTRRWADSPPGSPITQIRGTPGAGQVVIGPSDLRFDDLLAREVKVAIQETLRSFRRTVYEHAVLKVRGRPRPGATIPISEGARALRGRGYREARYVVGRVIRGIRRSRGEG